MEERLKKDASDLVLQIKSLKRIIVLLLLIIVAGLLVYFILRPKKFNLSALNYQVFGPVDPGVAHPNLDAYRATGAYASMSLYPKAKVHGILHETDDFRNYVNVIYEDFRTNHPPKPGYAWQIGVYPMVCKVKFDGNDRPRIGFYLIPTMAKANVSSPSPSDILDYFDAINGADSIYYITTNKGKQLTAGSYIYDEGHLWP